MDNKKVKDLMIPASQYPTVHKDTTVLQAIIDLDKAQERVPNNRKEFRAVLVLDNDGKVIGKVGHLAMMKALEPKYNKINDMEKLSRANLSPEFINMMMDYFTLWSESFYDVCKRASSIKVSDIMHPVNESIDENASLEEAVHKIIMWQSLSVLVSRGQEIVGIIRLSDIYNEVAHFIRFHCKNSNT